MTSSLAPLLTTRGWELLQAWEDRPERRTTDALALGATARKEGVEPELAAAILGQLALRDAAEAKFGPLARRMIFTRDGLEQATRMVVAVRHADRMRRAGCTHLADLGCGIGTESLAAAGLGLATLSVDIDEDAAAAAAVNLRDLPGSEVLCGDVMDLDIDRIARAGVDVIFADPARRTGSGGGSARINDPEQWAPPLSTVVSWRAHVEALGIKVAPGIAYEVLPSDFHVQWTSVDASLVEAALWSPPLAPEGPGRSAQVIRGSIAHVLVDPSCTSPDQPQRAAPHGDLEAFIAEPDDAVIRSGTLAALAEQLGAHLVDPRIAYLSAATLAPTPFAQVFEVLDVVPLKAKAVAAALRPLGVGSIEVKKRGADVDPAALRTQVRSALRSGSPQEGVVIATRIQGRHRAVIARRA